MKNFTKSNFGIYFDEEFDRVFFMKFKFIAIAVFIISNQCVENFIIVDLFPYFRSNNDFSDST